MASTYGACVRRLSNFLRNQDFVAATGERQTPIANLFEAIMLERGDFGQRGTMEFPVADQPITNAIWYKKAKEPNPLPDIPLFSFDNAMSVLGMLTFALPTVGAVAFAGVGAAQEILANLGRQEDLKVTLAQVSNPPPDPFKQVVDTLTATINTSAVTDDIDTMFGHIHAVQNVLNEYLVSPSQVLKAGADVPIAGLRTRPGLTREHVLDEHQGLGRIFAIEASDAWAKIAGADAQFRKKPMPHGLRTNPTYAQASLTAFLHACLTMVTAMQAYALLYPLPPKAFEPGWDGRNPDGSSYDPAAAIAATRGVAPPAGLPKNAWDALNTLYDRVNPAGRMSFTHRLKEIDEIWALIYTRLGSVSLQTGLPANRNGMWYLEADRNGQRDVSVNDMNGEMDKWAVVSAGTCGDNQVALLDWSLPAESAISGFTRFHTVLNQEWSTTIGHPSDNNDFFRGVSTGLLTVFEGGGLLGYVEWLNEHYDYFEYPIKTDSTPFTGALSEVFWAPPSADDASLADARQPGFLATQQGADTVAWLGHVLDKYCAEFGFDVDLDHDTNSVDFARLVGRVFAGIHRSACRTLGIAETPPPETPANWLPISIVNKTGAPIDVFWIDNAGKEIPYGTHAPDSVYQNVARPGRSWVVRDAAGTLLKRITQVAPMTAYVP